MMFGDLGIFPGKESHLISVMVNKMAVHSVKTILMNKGCASPDQTWLKGVSR